MNPIVAFYATSQRSVVSIMKPVSAVILCYSMKTNLATKTCCLLIRTCFSMHSMNGADLEQQYTQNNSCTMRSTYN